MNGDSLKIRLPKFREAIAAFDKGSWLLTRYDAMAHRYGKELLHQAEAHFLQDIGKTPDMTVTMLAKQKGISKSACSQMVHKLQKRGLLVQTRNQENLREYHLNLSDYGKEIYDAHEALDDRNMTRRYKKLDKFTDAELDIYVAVQTAMNSEFEYDLAENSYDGVVDIISES